MRQDPPTRSSSVLPQRPLGWLVAIAALMVAFAAGTLVPTRGRLPATPDEAQSEGSVLFSDLRPPDLDRAIDELEADQ